VANISKRLRYEVLRRDNFACRYCGATAPDAKLVVDAVTPEALGGSHRDPANLVTACDPCNNGKSSSAPDAPLVADVAQDALRWSQAITTAAGEMLARASGDVDAHAHFEKVWKRFGTGPRRKPLPKDPGWQQTVDSLLSAGLPMAILEECVEIAMGQRRVAEENVFRYMCGVAWNKVSELQGRAREITTGDPGDEDTPDVEDLAVQRWCQLILKQRDPGEVEVATRDCLGYTGDDGPGGVLWFVIHNLELDRASLRDSLRDLMQALPGGVGEQRIREHEAWQQDHPDVKYRPGSALTFASQWATEDMLLARARQEMALMPRDEYEMWVQRSRDENAEIAEHLSESYYVLDGARMAREALAAAQADGEG
jgi:hypothetical protein